MSPIWPTIAMSRFMSSKKISASAVLLSTSWCPMSGLSRGARCRNCLPSTRSSATGTGNSSPQPPAIGQTRRRCLRPSRSAAGVAIARGAERSVVAAFNAAAIRARSGSVLRSAPDGTGGRGWRTQHQPFGAAKGGAMQVRDGFVEAIGNTPLIKLRRASEETGCTILGKAEFLNPGGSVKDRPARHMILEAEKRGELQPGGVVVESTAGNTGIGLALVANARGYRTVIVIPQTQSQEKKDTLRLCGAELIEVPAVPYSNPNQYQHVGRRLAEHLRKSEPNGVLFADQWNNLDNRKAHYETTGPEIWQQTDGRIDGFICSIGTGGTIAGTSTFLRERKKDIVIGVADPCGAAMYNFFTTGEAKASEGNSITEGISLGRVTPIVADLRVDKAYIIPDSEAIPYIFDLLEYEGLCLGGSTAINVAGAVRLAKEMGPGHVIVTILADYGSRYQSKLFNPEFLRAQGFAVPAWLERKSRIGVPAEVRQDA